MRSEFYVAVVLVMLTVGALAGAQQKVDQGKPGTQGPWPVTIQGASVVINISSDGGFFGTTGVQPCATYKETNTSVGTSAALVPATPLAGRAWVRICNALLNAEGSQCICSATTTPTYTAASLGDSLAVSDCVMYPITSADAGVPLCICSGSGIRLAAAECGY